MQPVVGEVGWGGKRERERMLLKNFLFCSLLSPTRLLPSTSTPSVKLNSHAGYPSTHASPLITCSVLCIAPESICSCQFLPVPSSLSALYHILDQEILGVSVWEKEREEGWKRKAGVEWHRGPLVKVVPEIAQPSWWWLRSQPPAPVGFTLFSELPCWNVSHQLFLQMVGAGWAAVGSPGLWGRRR